MVAYSAVMDRADGPVPEMALSTTTRVGMPGPPGPPGAQAGVPLSLGASAKGGSSPPKKPIEIRTEFPETWLFDSLDFDSR